MSSRRYSVAFLCVDIPALQALWWVGEHCSYGGDTRLAEQLYHMFCILELREGNV
jgi:hypothetical protein